MSERAPSAPEPEGPPGMGPEMGPQPGIPPETVTGLGSLALNSQELPVVSGTSTQVFNEVLANNYLGLQERMMTNPVPTHQELEIGAFVEEIQPQAREHDPLADSELFLSHDVASATRELAFIDMYHELQERLTNNPTPTDEEWNMGAYKEELEPQVRDAIMLMRKKGYNTGSSGFWGHEVEQAMDVATAIDDNSLARLADHNIEVAVSATRTIRFKPKDRGNLQSIKKTWDMIADILPDLGQHADPAESVASDIFRYATKNGRYGDFMESWLWQKGALNGHMQPLTMTMLREGYSFGADVYAPARAAQAKILQMEQLAQVDKK